MLVLLALGGHSITCYSNEKQLCASTEFRFEGPYFQVETGYITEDRQGTELVTIKSFLNAVLLLPTQFKIIWTEIDSVKKRLLRMSSNRTFQNHAPDTPIVQTSILITTADNSNNVRTDAPFNNRVINSFDTNQVS